MKGFGMKAHTRRRCSNRWWFPLSVAAVCATGADTTHIVPQEVRVRDLNGSVQFRLSPETEWDIADSKTRPRMGSNLRTLAHSTVELVFESGATVVVGANSALALANLLKNTRQGAVRTRLRIDRGHVWLEMPSYAEYKGWFDIATPTALVYVRNSVVKVVVESTTTHADVYRGSVKMRDTKTGGEVVVYPHQRGTVTAGEKPSAVDLATAGEATKQRGGEVRFDVEKPALKIAMLTVQSAVAEEQDLESVSHFIAGEMDKISDIKVMFLDDVEAMLRVEGMNALLDCRSDSCISRTGAVLGVDLVVIGDIGKLGSRFVCNLKMIDVLRDRTESRVTATVTDDVGLLIDELPDMVDRLVTPQFRKASTVRRPPSRSGREETEDSPGHVVVPRNMVYVSPGTFLMGSHDGRGDEDEWPPHTVSVDGFLMDEYEVSRIEFERVMGYNSSTFKGCPSCPADNVTWYEAEEFCRKQGKRLPTEAEWEYACRAGTRTAFSTGTSISSREANFNGSKPYGDAPRGPFRGRPTPVGTFEPNPWGLHDMHGNLWEWCADWYGKDYYKSSPSRNPRGPDEGEYRVVRGGAWISDGGSLRSANRIGYEPSVRMKIFGFRCAKDAAAK